MFGKRIKVFEKLEVYENGINKMPLMLIIILNYDKLCIYPNKLLGISCACMCCSRSLFNVSPFKPPNYHDGQPYANSSRLRSGNCMAALILPSPTYAVIAPDPVIYLVVVVDVNRLSRRCFECNKPR